MLFQREVGKKSHDRTFFSSLQAVFVNKFSKIKSSSSASFWYYLTIGKAASLAWFLLPYWGVAFAFFFYYLSVSFRIFLLAFFYLVSKNHIEEISDCAKSFAESAKDHCFFKVPQWQQKRVRECKPGKPVSYFSNNVAETYSYSRNI